MDFIVLFMFNEHFFKHRVRLNVSTGDPGSIRSVAWAEAQSAMSALNMCSGVTSLQPAVLNFVKSTSRETFATAQVIG